MSAKIAHKINGRLLVKLDPDLTQEEKKVLVEDLKVSPGITKVELRESSVIIEVSRQMRR
jgi:hypothetical protein